jgi:hypothetical protein
VIIRIWRALSRHWPAVMLAVACQIPAASAAAQISVSSEVQGAAYPHDARGRSAEESDLRGWASVEYDRRLRDDVIVRGDAVVYAAGQRSPLVDGEAMLAWRGKRVEIAGGLLRERWGRFTNSELDTLGPMNTLFSLVEPELRLSQPTVRTTLFFHGVSIDAYALIGRRAQPVPGVDRRFGFGVPARDVAERGHLGDQAVAVRVSGTKPSFDWGAHVFGGLNRRPTFVPRFGPNAELAAIDGISTEILQVGGEVDTTVADWHFLAEGFSRVGAVNVTGQKQTYSYVATAAEYQRLGAFDGAYDVIPRFEVTVDTRGDRADLPFGSSIRAGMRIATTQLLPMQVEMAYSYDWAFRGHGIIASAEKRLAESPTMTLGFRFTTFAAGDKPSVLDIWKRDLELSSYVRIELSR